MYNKDEQVYRQLGNLNSQWRSSSWVNSPIEVKKTLNEIYENIKKTSSCANIIESKEHP